MTMCPNLDDYVLLTRLSGDPVEVARHVAECPRCATELRALGELRMIMTVEETPRPGFEDDVMASFPTEDDASRARPGLGWLALHGAMGALSGAMVVAAAGLAAPDTGSSLPLAAALFGASAVGSSWWSARPSPPRAPALRG